MILRLENCLLRPLEARDLEQLYDYRNSPDIHRSLGGFSTGYSSDDLLAWLEYHRTLKNEVLWCIADNENKQCLGHIGLYNIDHRVRKAELALMIGSPKARGKGIGFQSCQAVMKFGFDELNLRRLELSLLANNSAALALYNKLGFEQEGVLAGSEYREGHYQDVVLMAKIR